MENAPMSAHKTSSLTVTLPSDREIVLTREFDAPRSLVFEALGKSEHLRHWWGQKDSTVSVCEVDFRPDGAWRIVEHAADGNDYGFRGEVRATEPPERIVQ